MIDSEKNNSQVNIEGDVGSGSAIGDGQVTAGNIMDADQIRAGYIAGRDIIFQNVPASEREERPRQLGQRLDNYVECLEKIVRAPDDLPKPRHPYLGLTPYTLSDHPQFWGRERLIQELAQKIATADRLDTRLLIVYGAPGVGKTSLLQAGLQPYLIRQGHLPFHIPVWRQPPIHAFYSLALEGIDPQEVTLLQALTWINHVTKRRIYLIFDQFEAFFGNEFSDLQRAHFIAQLGECLQVGTLPAVFILAIRTEQFAEFNSFQPRIPDIFRNELEVPPLTRSEATEAITRPVGGTSDQGVFAPELLEVMLDDLEDGGIVPAELQIVCDTLWNYHVASGVPVDVETYRRAGGPKGILGQYLQSLLERRVRKQYRDLSRSALVALLSSEGKPTAKTHEQLARSLGDTPELDGALTDLTNLGLIYAETDTSGHKIYAISHHYLEKVIQVDPNAIELKRAEEMLEAGLRQFSQHGFSLAEHTYQFIKRRVEAGGLGIPSEAEALWQLSQRASALRHLTFRALVMIVLAPLMAIPALVWGNLDRQIGPAPPADGVQTLIYLFIGIAAALMTAFTNGLGAVAATLIEYRFAHWSQWRKLGLFASLLLVPGLSIGILGALAQPSGGTILVNQRQSLIWGVICGLFFGLALYLSVPRQREPGLWRQVRWGVVAGPICGLLLALALLASDRLLGTELPAAQQTILLFAAPAYLTTLTLSFAFGIGIADRLLLGSWRDKKM
jgi:hypothetical protein